MRIFGTDAADSEVIFYEVRGNDILITTQGVVPCVALHLPALTYNSGVSQK